ncbi:GNAT family N-acetyltransferase [Aestuariispira ectoiniformans]|uniref:GNAT family N-acetyltransferase n=1 Tax=Aestuariispira ectoiniformans TaxID=2775080 RepID=UPI00223A89A2|nr:GNAT family N-acetyltransferase [Aestuariispira ectoiniformans]
MIVREAIPADVDRLHELMVELAKFEEYIDEFAVTKSCILEQGFGENATFKAFVAVYDGEIVGMAVTYVIRWTYTLRPKLVLKELYVDRTKRQQGTGKALISAVQSHAASLGAGEIIWTVMAGNEYAERFYLSAGGEPDRKWLNWSMKP